MHIIAYKETAMKKALRIIISLLILVLIAWCIQGGVSLIKANAITHSTEADTLIDTGDDLTVDLHTGPSYAHVTYRLAPYAIVTVPQIAVWVEDSSGQFLHTLYVTPAVRTIGRPAALPVWSHRANDGADAVTSATPLGDSRITAGIGEAACVLVEVNLSCDYNAYYRPGLKADEAGYNTDYAGQPSLIYAGNVTPGESVTLTPVGHGAPDGADGEINPDLEHMTSALEILEEITVQVP